MSVLNDLAYGDPKVKVPFTDHRNIEVLVFQKNLLQNSVGHCPARTSWSIIIYTRIHIMLVVLRMCGLIILAVVSAIKWMSLPRVWITHQHFSYVLLYLPLWVNLFLRLRKSDNTAHCYDYAEIKSSLFNHSHFACPTLLFLSRSSDALLRLSKPHSTLWEECNCPEAMRK